MDELLNKASEFLSKNPFINEVELEEKYNGFSNIQQVKVHLVRITPAPITYYPYYYWPQTQP